MTNFLSWNELKTKLKVGNLIFGRVTKHEPYGVIVDIGYGFDGLIQITDFKDKDKMTSEEYPLIGSEIRAVVLGFKDHGHQVWLGIKPSQIAWRMR